MPPIERDKVQIGHNVADLQPAAEKIVEGHGTGGAGRQDGPKTFRIDPNKLHFGTKVATGPQGQRLAPLPPAEYQIEAVKIGDETVFKCTAIAYGRPEIKVLPEKDAKNDYKLTGRTTERLQLVWRRQAITVPDPENEGKSTRMLVDIETPDGVKQFAMTGSIDFGGKPSEQVVKREPRAAAAQNQ